MTPEELGQKKKIATLLSKAVANRESPKSIDYFQDENKFYRVIRGEAAAKDIQQSGVVRSAETAGVDYEPRSKGKIDLLSNRPTRWPSFAKGAVSMSYARTNPNHYIIETKSPLSVSTLGRHGKGATYFPSIDPKTQLPHTSLPASEVKLWKHVGEEKYEPVRIPQAAWKGTVGLERARRFLQQGAVPRAAKTLRIAGKVAGPALEIYDAGKYFFGGENAEENQKIKDQYAESVGTMGQRLFGADSSVMERLGAVGDVLSPTKNVLGTYETLKQWNDAAQDAQESGANLKTAESTADAVTSARRQQYSDDEFKALPQKDRSKVMLDIRRRIRKE